MSEPIEILSWNVNGIRAVANKKALKWIDDRRPDILCLQEISSPTICSIRTMRR